MKAATLVARVLFPRLTARIRRAAGQFVGPPRITRLEPIMSAPYFRQNIFSKPARFGVFDKSEER